MSYAICVYYVTLFGKMWTTNVNAAEEKKYVSKDKAWIWNETMNAVKCKEAIVIVVWKL